MKLLRSQENELFDVIVQGGFSPSQFELNKDYNNETVTIKMKDSDYFFQFRFYAEMLELKFTNVHFSPGNKTEFEDHNPYSSWIEIDKYLLDWLSYLNRESEQPDKWAGMFESNSQIGWSPDEHDNNQFTFVEVQEIEVAIHRAKSGMKGLGLAEEQFNLIEGKLNYIAEKAKTLGRVDWKNLFIGTMITTIVQLALPPETGQTIWLLLKEAFKKVILISLN